MAQFKNVSRLDRDLSLPEWYDHRHVEAGGVVDVEDALAKKYDFDQPGVWEPADDAAKKAVETTRKAALAPPVYPFEVPAEVEATTAKSDKKAKA